MADDINQTADPSGRDATGGSAPVPARGGGPKHSDIERALDFVYTQQQRDRQHIEFHFNQIKQIVGVLTIAGGIVAYFGIDRLVRDLVARQFIEENVRQTMLAAARTAVRERVNSDIQKVVAEEIERQRDSLSAAVGRRRGTLWSGGLRQGGSTKASVR